MRADSNLNELELTWLQENSPIQLRSMSCGLLQDKKILVTRALQGFVLLDPPAQVKELAAEGTTAVARGRVVHQIVGTVS